MQVEEARIEYSESGPFSPPTDASGIPYIVGIAEDGPYEPQLISTLSDLDKYKSGPLVGLSASMISRGVAHWVCRVEQAVAGKVGTPIKFPGQAKGAIALSYGTTYTPGASKDGIGQVTALTAGLSFEAVTLGNDKPLVVRPVDPAKRAIVIELATDATGKSKSTWGEVVKAAAAEPTVVNAVLLANGPNSDGTGVALPTAGAIQLDTGTVQYRALKRQLKVEQPAAAANQKLKITLSGDTIRIDRAADASGRVTTTPNDIVAEVAANPTIAAEILVTPILMGSGLVSETKSPIALSFGSPAKLEVLGTPTDRFDIVIKVPRGGIAGGTPVPSLQWSADDAESLDPRNRGGSFSSDVPIPVTGEVALADDLLNTGLKIRITGAMDDGDMWRFSTTAPQGNLITIASALNKGLDNDRIDCGYAIPADAVDASTGTAISQVCVASEARPRYRHLYALLNARDKLPTETDDAYEQAISDDWNGDAPVVVQSGKGTLVTNWGRHLNVKSSRWQRRPASWYIALTRAQRPVHEQPGNRNAQTGPGSAQNYGFSVFYFDAAKRLGLRVNGRATSVEFRKGWYATEWLTLAPTASNFKYGPWMAVITGTAALLQSSADNFVLDSADADDRGRLTGPARNSIARALANSIEPFLWDLKKDNKMSARRNPAEVPLVDVLGNYDAVTTGELRATCQVFPAPFFRRVIIRLVLATQPAALE